MALYFITGNKNKFEEVKSFLPDILQLDVDLTEIQEVDPQKIIQAKLKEARKIHTGEFIIEDTSLSMDALGGLPGPFIKWFLKTIGTKGLYEIAKKMGNYKAKAKIIIGFSNSKRKTQFFEGEVEGEIMSPRGENGFGWDAIFKPKGSDKTFAQMTPKEKYEEKNNMRSIALLKLKKSLNSGF